MADQSLHDVFSEKKMAELFTSDRSDLFFDALYGDASEGAYDISLVFTGAQNQSLKFEFHLKQRPGKCLACNLTYGLPEVFIRHPVIDLKGLSHKIAEQLGQKAAVKDWEVGMTSEVSSALHVIPFTVHLE
ncbi:MAG: pancreas/duodenum homeobox protein 1 [Desulfobacteraceae bacterium]|nr:MAG: pancreas/duodenum homeobox protein 1 [Desulfobacteraceae bacterium]